MFDTMTMTKIVGAFCGSLLVYMLIVWASDGLFHSGGGHYGDDHAQAYVIDTGGEEAAEEETVEVAFADVYAAADASAGERLWRQCQACHKLEDGANGTGPHLFGVVGRDKGSVGGYGYSDTLETMEGDWTPENLDGFIEDPKGYAPGTKMAYRGMDDVEDRANLIAYIANFGG